MSNLYRIPYDASDHAPDDLLDALILNELERQDQTAALSHVLVCKTCLQRARDAAVLIGALSGDPAYQMDVQAKQLTAVGFA